MLLFVGFHGQTERNSQWITQIYYLSTGYENKQQNIIYLSPFDDYIRSTGGNGISNRKLARLPFVLAFNNGISVLLFGVSERAGA